MPPEVAKKTWLDDHLEKWGDSIAGLPRTLANSRNWLPLVCACAFPLLWLFLDKGTGEFVKKQAEPAERSAPSKSKPSKQDQTASSADSKISAASPGSRASKPIPPVSLPRAVSGDAPRDTPQASTQRPRSTVEAITEAPSIQTSMQSSSTVTKAAESVPSRKPLALEPPRWQFADPRDGSSLEVTLPPVDDRVRGGILSGLSATRAPSAVAGTRVLRIQDVRFEDHGASPKTCLAERHAVISYELNDATGATLRYPAAVGTQCQLESNNPEQLDQTALRHAVNALRTQLATR